MNLPEQQAILTVALLAAFADGEKADTEREAIRRMAESLGHEAGGAGLAQLYQDVLLKRATVATAVAGLSDPGHRHLACEMAVCVCDADGRKSPAEAAFLADLKTRLGLGAVDTVAFEQEEAALVAASSRGFPATGVVTAAGAAAVIAAPVPVTVLPNNPSAAEMDKLILNASLLNGALELLPQSWASMAIIPLQIRMV
jgi:tellurite resistance protein